MNRIIIPARWESTRFPGKPLALLEGATGIKRSLIERTWRQACGVPGIDQIIIATDDIRIASAARAFGADVVLTDEECANGTERCAVAARSIADRDDLIINFQGDALLTPHHAVTRLIARMDAEPGMKVATPAIRCCPSLYGRMVADQAAGRSGGTCVVFDEYHNALYFSKAIIPHLPRDRGAAYAVPIYQHVGVYAFRASTLADFPRLASSSLERTEGLEQLRWLNAGRRVGVVIAPRPEFDLVELNNPGDVAQIEDILFASGIE